MLYVPATGMVRYLPTQWLTAMKAVHPIREAGYITVTRLRGEKGQAVGIRYSVSQRRSDQPTDGAWVPALPGEREIRPQPMCGHWPHVANHHTWPMRQKCRSHHVWPMTFPPHPPEEVTTSSPYPLGEPVGSLPSQREEGEEADFAEEDLRAAADVLELLPAPWTQGRLNASKLAPKLLAVMAVQG